MKHTITVPPEAAGQRADVFVAAQFPQFSRSVWRRQFEAGKVERKNSQNPLKASQILEAGWQLQIIAPQIITKVIDLPVLYEDDDVLVINKPTGILTHAKDLLAQEATVADFVAPRNRDRAQAERTGIVHRLDRETSGVIIAAKTVQAKQWLQNQFATRAVRKTYIALVQGRLEPAQAILRLPIERNPKKPHSFRVGASGKSAETTYKVIEYLPHHTLVELTPRTGRTHQLRVHLQYLGHPIASDKVYGKAHAAINRLFLHAAALTITLPDSRTKTFRAPLPPELVASLAKLKSGR